MSWCSNISGVTASVRATSSRSSSTSRSTRSSNSARAVATLRGEPLCSRPRTEVSACVVSLVSRSVATIGMVAPRPSISRVTCSGSSNPPLSTMPAICGKFADTCAVSTPSTTSGRSPGVTTTAPSKSRSSTCGSVIAATTMPVLSCDNSDSSPLTSVPSQAAIRSATDGALSSGSSGSANAGTPCPSSALTTASRSPSALLATMANSVPWLAFSSLTARSAAVLMPSSVRSWALSTSSTGLPRLAASRALNENSVGAPTSV